MYSKVAGADKIDEMAYANKEVTYDHLNELLPMLAAFVRQREFGTEQLMAGPGPDGGTAGVPAGALQEQHRAGGSQQPGPPSASAAAQPSTTTIPLNIR